MTNVTDSAQKKCSYCDTPAPRLAFRCKTCGSPLPRMLPPGWKIRDGRLVFRAPVWSLRKTGFVCAGGSAVLGALSPFGLFAMIALFWVALFTPGTLTLATWRNAQNNMTVLAGNAAISVGVWLLCAIILKAASASVGGPF